MKDLTTNGETGEMRRVIKFNFDDSITLSKENSDSVLDKTLAFSKDLNVLLEVFVAHVVELEELHSFKGT